uniref:Uncharacterized protein n=1 Tax=Lepeophtheirus salmonis TaxID=72036 RepID=A0A0K2U9K3_LEPSM
MNRQRLRMTLSFSISQLLDFPWLSPLCQWRSDLFNSSQMPAFDFFIAFSYEFVLFSQKTVRMKMKEYK